MGRGARRGSALGPRARGERAARRRDRRVGRPGRARTPRALERTPGQGSPARTRCCAWRASTSSSSHDAANAVDDAPARARDRAEGRRRARRARSPLPRRRRCTTSSPRSCAAASRCVQDPDEQLELYFRRGAIFSDALGDLEQALACYTSVLEQESRNRRALEAIESDPLPPRGLEEAVRDLREADRRRRRRRGDGRHLRAHGAHLLRRAQRRGQGDRAVRPRARHPRRRAAGPRRPSRTSRRAASKWEELVEIIERQVAVAPGSRSDSRSTSTSAACGKRSSAASATHSMRGSPPIASTATTSRRCARWRGSTARRRRGTSCRQTIRRIIDVGQLIGRDRRERDDRAVRTARPARGRRARPRRRSGRCMAPRDRDRPVATSAPSRPSRRCSPAKAAGRRRSTCSRSARSSSRTRSSAARRCCRPPSTWEEKVEDLTRAAQVYERVRASRPDEHDRVGAPRGDLPRSSTSGPSSSRSCSSARSSSPTSRSRSASSTRSPRSTRARSATRRARSTCSQAAFKRDYSHDETANELERLATATNRWQELLDEYTNRVNELEREDRGAAADLWVKIGRWYGEHLSPPRVRDPLGAAGAAHRPGHTGALGGMAELQRKRGSLGRADRDAAASRGGRAGPGEEDRRSTSTSPSCSSARCRTSAAPIHAYQQALDLRRSVAHGAHRPRSALPPHREVGAADRRARTVARTSSNDDSEIIKFRLEVGSDLGPASVRRGPGDHRLPEGPRPRSVEPDRAARPRRSLREDGPVREVPRCPRGTARRVAVGCRARLALRAHGGGVGRALRQARPRRGGLEKIVAIDNRNYGAYRELARLYQAGRQVRSARRDVPQPHHGDDRRGDAHRPVRRDGHDLRGGAQGRRSRDRGLQRRPVVRRRRAARARCPRPPLREDPGVGPRHRHDGAPRPADRATRASRSTCTGAWAASSTPSSATPRQRKRTSSAVSPSTPATCRRWRR